MENMNFKEEVLCEWFCVCKALEHAAHKTSITKILESSNSTIVMLLHDIN